MNRNMETYILSRVKELFSGDCSGHDFFHTERVYKTALRIAQTESCDRDIVALAALLHDADDPKLFKTQNYGNARQIMAEAGVSQEIIDRVVEIIRKLSFKGTGTEVPETLEGQIVQDADRLDAIGAIGIARAFAYGGNHQRKMYDPDVPPDLHMDEAAYRRSRGTTINHFHEKLLRLEGLMNTESARRMAADRTIVMKAFLTEFLAEWNGER